MLALKCKLKDAEKWKQYLIHNNLFDQRYRFKKEKDNIYFPVKSEFKSFKHELEFVDIDLKRVEIIGTLKENLEQELTKEELAFVKTAHDIIGNIAILEIPKDLEHREKIIAETLLKVNKNIKTVLKKAASHDGTFRTQKKKYLAGINTKETIYKENNVKLKLDVEKVYFSIRLSNERKRIVAQIKAGEKILVMFSGCAPYPIVLSKNTDAKTILGIEINPDGHKYGLENIKLNKCKNVELICGDVRAVVPDLKKENKKFDRIIMPLPKTADEFLDDALSLSKYGTIINFYDFSEESKFHEAIEKINKACKNNKIKYEILQIVKCGQHSPNNYRICVDFKIL
jgi:tRNA (guanine37-N1)-methyltransferase